MICLVELESIVESKVSGTHSIGLPWSYSYHVILVPNPLTASFGLYMLINHL